MRAFAERWLPWVALVVLVAGIAAFGITKLMHDSSPTALPHKATPLNAAVDFDA